MDNSIYMTYFGVGIKKRTYRNMTFFICLHHINFGMHIQHIRVSQLPSCNYKLFLNFSTSFFLLYKTYNIAHVHLLYITLFYKIYNVGEHIYTVQILQCQLNIYVLKATTNKDYHFTIYAMIICREDGLIL